MPSIELTSQTPKHHRRLWVVRCYMPFFFSFLILLQPISAFPEHPSDTMRLSRPEEAQVRLRGDVYYLRWEEEREGELTRVSGLSRHLSEEDSIIAGSGHVETSLSAEFAIAHGTTALSLLFAKEDPNSPKLGEKFWFRRSNGARAVTQLFPGGDILAVTPFHGMTMGPSPPPIPREVSWNLGPMLEVYLPRWLLDQDNWIEFGVIPFIDPKMSFHRIEYGDALQILYLGLREEAGEVHVKTISCSPAGMTDDGAERTRVTMLIYDKLRTHRDHGDKVIALPQRVTRLERFIEAQSAEALDSFDDPEKILSASILSFELREMTFEKVEVMDALSPHLGRVALSLAIAQPKSNSGDDEVTFTSSNDPAQMDALLRQSANSPFLDCPESLISAGTLRMLEGIEEGKPTKRKAFPVRALLLFGGIGLCSMAAFLWLRSRTPR